jgi:hypothetical protein
MTEKENLAQHNPRQENHNCGSIEKYAIAGDDHGST